LKKRLGIIQKQLSILLIMCMFFTMLPVTAPVLAAEDNSVKVTYVPSILWGGFGRYVEYEMDGVKYRTDEAPSAVNREAWNRMSDEDRRTTYNTLYTATARKAAFGENGYAYIKHWTHQSSEWYDANKIWKERVAKRTFPELQPIFNATVSLSGLYSDYNDLKNYVIPANIPANNSYRKAFQEEKEELDQYFAIGKEYYQKAVDMRAKSIGTAVSFTAVQCTQMLTDMLFVPSVVNGASLANSGMIADVTNVLLQVVGADGGSLAEKLNVVLENGETAHLTAAEQVHLYASYMKTYAKLAENCKADMDTKMEELRTVHNNLEILSQGLEIQEQEKASKKEAEQTSYEESIEETFVTPLKKEPGDGDDVHITFAFKWKTEEELKKDLFKNNFDQWLNDNSDEEGFAYPEAAELLFAEVLAQKGVLDNEVIEKVDIISGMFMEAYNSANDKLAAFELELNTLKDGLTDDLSDYKNNEAVLYRIPVGASYFYGTDSFKPELENYYDGLPYDSFYDQLGTHISDYRTKVEAMLEDVELLKSSSEGLYSSIEIDVQNVIFYLNLLESLEDNYQSLYNSVVWELHNDTEIDPSINYENNPFYINPINTEAGEAYRINRFSEAFVSANLPEEVYDPNITTDEFAEALAITRPISILNEAYNIYMELSDVSEILESSYNDSIVNDEVYKAGRTNYYEEMDAWLAEYKDAETKMANALAEIKNITNSYESSWEGTYFLGAYDNYGYNPYLYNTQLVSISAFDVADLREYIRNGGNTAILYNKLKEIERNAEIYEVETKELIGEIGVLDFEMQQLRNSTLDDYADNKGTPLKTFYSLRQENGLNDKWDNLTRDGEDVLYYFNICDIPEICDILKGETDDVVFLRNAIKEIRGYLDANSVATVPVSNRLYDIYKKATGIKEVYESSSHLLTEELRSEVLNLYANPGDVDDILNTIYDVRDKHEGINFTYPPSQHEGVDEYTPVGDLTYTSSAPGSMAVQTPIYHPVAVNTRILNATLYIYDDSWTEVQRLNQTEDELQGIIDTERDMMEIPFAGLEDGREYLLEWEITYGTGPTDYETGSYFFTYDAPVGVFAIVELNKDTYDTATVTVSNNSGTELSDQYVFLDGYDEKENLVLSESKLLNYLDAGETTTIVFTLDEVIFSAEAYVAKEDGQKPPVPVRLEIEGGDSVITIPQFGEANTSASVTAIVYDQYGSVYSEVYGDKTIDWNISPEIEGVSVDEDGVITVTSAAGAAINSIDGKKTLTVTATLRGTDIFATEIITIIRDSAIANKVWIQRGALLFEDGDTDFIIGPLGNDSSKTYTYSAVLADQYGAEIFSNPSDFDWSSAGASSGIMVNGSQVIIEKESKKGNFSLATSHTNSGLSVQVTVYVIGEDVDVEWTEIEEKLTSTNYIYGDRIDKAGPLGDGTATAGDIILQGFFSYKDSEGISNAGEQTITVIFTVTTPGEYQGMRLEHDVAVTVAKREITGTLRITGKAAVGETLTAAFTSEIDPEEYDIVWLSGGDIAATGATYTVTSADRGKTITVKAVGKKNYTGEVIGESGISIPSAALKTSEPLPTQNEQDITAEVVSGTTTTTIVDRAKLEAYLETAEKNSEIVIPISENNTSTALLPLNTFGTMVEKDITLTVQSGSAAISIPADSIDIEAVKVLFDAETEDSDLQGEIGDIHISITISQLSSDENAALHSKAESEGLEILGSPVVFSISASNNGKTVEVTSFNQYVQRSIEVTQEIAENLSTVLVFEEDNTFRHVPTSVYFKDGKYYVVIASLTNSTYVLVSQKVSFSDTDGKWYEDAVKEMASRQIIRGTGNSNFAGDREITRAEFAAIIVRALGLPAKGVSTFSDVPKDMWYYGAVAAATNYDIVSGRDKNRFDPMAKITREEAMQMVFNSSKLTPLERINETVNSNAFSDYKEKSPWAIEAVDFNLTNSLILGSNGKINSKANITRGEAATVILRLLQKSTLVN